VIVDFTPANDLEQALVRAATDPADKGTRRVVKDGFKIWVDKKGLLKKLEAALA